MKPLTDAEFKYIMDFVRDGYGINLENKRTLVEARLAFDIERRGFSSYAAYIAQVMQDPDSEEAHHMVGRLSTNYTFFFRESSYVDYLNRRLLPELKAAGRCIKLWCAGCSSGEEAFSVASVIERYIVTSGISMSYHILATDIDTHSLETARAGKYPVEQLEKIPVAYRFIHKCGDQFTFHDELRAKIEWKYENLLTCQHSEQFDMIFCRNVMIYFQSALRQKLAKKLYGALKKKGCLFLSATEGFDIQPGLFTHDAPSVYRKR